MSGTGEASRPSLIEWAGGPPAIARLIDAFYDRVEHDDLLSPFFPGGVSEDHREHVTLWWIEVFGGPAEYTDPRRLRADAGPSPGPGDHR